MGSRPVKCLSRNFASVNSTKKHKGLQAERLQDLGAQGKEGEHPRTWLCYIKGDYTWPHGPVYLLWAGGGSV